MNNAKIIRGGNHMMSFNEFLIFRDVKIRDDDHKRIVSLFYPYLFSVCGDLSKLPKIIGEILSEDFSSVKVKTACFNQNNEKIYPYDPIDFYVLFDNGVEIYIYGTLNQESFVHLESDQFVIFILGDKINGSISFKDSNHIIIE